MPPSTSLPIPIFHPPIPYQNQYFLTLSLTLLAGKVSYKTHCSHSCHMPHPGHSFFLILSHVHLSIGWNIIAWGKVNPTIYCLTIYWGPNNTPPSKSTLSSRWKEGNCYWISVATSQEFLKSGKSWHLIKTSNSPLLLVWVLRTFSGCICYSQSVVKAAGSGWPNHLRVYTLL